MMLEENKTYINDSVLVKDSQGDYRLTKKFDTYTARLSFAYIDEDEAVKLDKKIKSRRSNYFNITFGIYQTKKEFETFENQTYQGLGLAHLIWSKNCILKFIELKPDRIYLIGGMDQKRFEFYQKVFFKLGFKLLNKSSSYKNNLLYYKQN